MRPRILLFCWEAGSAGAVIPVAECAARAGCELRDASLEPARSILHRRFSGLLTAETSDAAGIPADVMLAGLGHPKNTDGWTMWRRLHAVLPAFVLLDHWKGVERFMRRSGELNREALPEMVGVIDAATRERLLAAGMSPTQVVVVGNMACHEVRRHATADIGRSVRARLGLAPQQRVYFLASETLHVHGFHEDCTPACHMLEQHAVRSGGTLLEWAQDQARRDGAMLLVRPHPNQGGRLRAVRDTNAVAWDAADDNEILSVAQRVYGLSTMILAKAVAAGIDAVNVANELADWFPEQSFMSPLSWPGVLASGQIGRTNGGRCRPVAGGTDPQRLLALLNELGNHRRRT